MTILGPRQAAGAAPLTFREGSPGVSSGQRWRGRARRFLTSHEAHLCGNGGGSVFLPRSQCVFMPFGTVAQR